ncbi:MAG: DNA-protecting protein DprA [Oligoflexia bacterium]|nr:DNA-protecting protein DprA [Oligoflexia bacterium]
MQSLPNTISPYQEMVAYELIWARPEMTVKSVTELFAKYKKLPSQIVESDRVKFPPELEMQVRKHLENKKGFSVSIVGTYQYPSELRKSIHPLELFYYRGNIDLLSTRGISIVGSRKCSDEGKQRTRQLTSALVKAGFTIISGLALGVDTEAHTTAIREGGQTIGVIGTPIDEYYPKENKELQDEIACNHLLIAQVPFYKHHIEPFSAHRFWFPKRNETMAALSCATVIVEASDTSGSLTQARECLRQNKKLFILDSCFNRKDVKWPKNYEAKGAIRVKTMDDIFKVLL